MAVQQNKKSPSKRGMHRAHDSLPSAPLAVEPLVRGFIVELPGLRVPLQLLAVPVGEVAQVADRDGAAGHSGSDPEPRHRGP